jgi:hypothetical protein
MNAQEVFSYEYLLITLAVIVAFTGLNLFAVTKRNRFMQEMATIAGLLAAFGGMVLVPGVMVQRIDTGLGEWERIMLVALPLGTWCGCMYLMKRGLRRMPLPEANPSPSL